MDNFFQLLFLLIILYSVFVNVFGKKKTDKQRVEIPNYSKGEDSDDSSPMYSKDSIFGDLFGNKIPDAQIKNLPKKQAPNQETNVKAENDKAQQEAYLDPSQTPINLSQPIIVDLAPLNKRTLELKEKIKNPATLRDLILVSEILNKPKALRR